MVLGGISLEGRTVLHVLARGSLTAIRYRDEILRPLVRPYAGAVGPGFLLMQDNARPHVAGVCQQFLQDEGSEAMDWPARSPDLNQIEHIWDIMFRTIHQRHVTPQTVQELADALVQVWEEIPQETIRHLIRSMPRMAARRALKAVLVDLSGTLHIEDTAIPGAQEALKRLRSAPVTIRFVTNTTKECKRTLLERLRRLHFDISEDEIFTSLTAARNLLEQKDVRPMLLVDDGALPDFEGIATDSPNAVLIGLAPEHFNYQRMNLAFRQLPFLWQNGSEERFDGSEKSKIVRCLAEGCSSLEIAKLLRRDHRTIKRFMANSQQCRKKRVGQKKGAK
ncbi:unnamed protein product [Ranitomeya imitator]|uniref:Tc1-like transposase DDE domain-containing protein n=1 Tax=Ranitomeya imitator TaxID=111125 RepID=A0ABN9KUI2_9NEOB|nr:unnamed protein product [Ranitomeya imitator]